MEKTAGGCHATSQWCRFGCHATGQTAPFPVSMTLMRLALDGASEDAVERERPLPQGRG
jgi:hypothetical protein